MIKLTTAPVSWGSRLNGSMFQAAPFSEASSRKGLGQNEQQWFARAKAAIAEYDELWARTQQIANKTYREQVAAKYHPSASNQEGALYRRNSVAYNVSQAESYTPVNYLVYNDSQQQNRISKLEEFNRGFRQDVEFGEKEYGILPAPEIIEKTSSVTVQQVPGWVVPAAIGAGLLIVGLVFFTGD